MAAAAQCAETACTGLPATPTTRAVALRPFLACAGVCEVLAALMGPDQASEVQRQALLSARRLGAALVAAGRPDVLEPHLPALIPPMCAVAASTAGASHTSICSLHQRGSGCRLQFARPRRPEATSACGLIGGGGGVSGPIKVTAELSLSKLLQLEGSGGVSALAQRYLATGACHWSSP